MTIHSYAKYPQAPGMVQKYTAARNSLKQYNAVIVDKYLNHFNVNKNSYEDMGLRGECCDFYEDKVVLWTEDAKNIAREIESFSRRLDALITNSVEPKIRDWQAKSLEMVTYDDGQ